MPIIPLDKMMLVLDVFRPQNPQTGMSKNQVYRTSSSRTGIQNKGPFFKAIRFLVDALILDSKKVNKQKEVISLTQLGQEIMNFLNDIHRCRRAEQELRKTISNYEDAGEVHVDENDWKVIRGNKLLSRGWTKEEIESYDQIKESLRLVLNLHRRHLYNCILHRYSLILITFEINEIAENILTKIITDQLMKQLLPDEEEPELQDHWFAPDYSTLELPVLQDMGELYGKLNRLRESIWGDYLTNRFTSEAVINLISSMLILLKPSITDVEFSFGTKRLFATTSSANSSEILQDRSLHQIRKSNELTEIFNRYVLEQERLKEKT
jgi:hypothetical protein